MRALLPGAAQWLLVIWVACFIHDVTSRPSTSQPTQSTPPTLSTESIALEKNNSRYKHKEINKKRMYVNSTLVFNEPNGREGNHIQNSNLKGKHNIFKVVPSVEVKEYSQDNIDVLHNDKGNVSREFDEGLNNRNVSLNMLYDYLLNNSSSVHEKNNTVRIETVLVLPVELAGYNEEGVVNTVGVQMKRHANNNNALLHNTLDDPPEKKVIKHRVKRNRMEQIDKPIFSERFPGSIHNPRTIRHPRLMDDRDKQVFHDFLQQSITDLQSNAGNTQKKIVQIDITDPDSFSSDRRRHGQYTSNNEGTRGNKHNFSKRWPDSAITTAEELENYQNYTSLNFDGTSPDVMTFHKWDKDSNPQDVSAVNNKRNQTMNSHGVSTSPKKPVIHQVLTEWSDTPNFDNIKKPWQKITNGEQYLDEITLNEFRPDDTSVGNEQIVNNEYFAPTEPTFHATDSGEMININYLATKRTPSFDDVPVVYIRPKPSYFNRPSNTNYNNGVYVSSTRKPTTPPHDLFKRPLRNKNKNKHKTPSHSSTLPSLLYTLSPGIYSSVPHKAVTPSYNSDDVSKPSYRPTNVVNIYDPNKPDPDEIHFPDKDYNSNPATHIIVQDDCPTLYVTINNTVQSEAKEGCADIHLLINSNVLQTNVLIEDPASFVSDVAFDPVPENNNAYPVLPVAPIVASDVPVVEGTNSVVPIVPLAISPLVGNTIPGGVQSPLASPGISSVSTNFASLNPGSLPSLSPPPGIGSLSNFVSGGDSPDDEEDSIGSWIHSATGVLAWMTFLNPFNYGLFSLFLAPLVIIVAGGAGLAALMAPWVWSMENDKTKRVVVIEEPTRWYWAWDPSYKTWNWAPYPDYGRDWGTGDSKIVESSIVKVANSNNDEPEYFIDEMVSNIGGNVKKWAYDLYGNIIDARRLSKRKKRSTSSIEDWKKRRK